MKVAYVLDSFPNVTETFILDEITSLLDEGIDCRIFSLEQPQGDVVHADAQRLLDDGRVQYVTWPQRRAKAVLLARRMVTSPGRTSQALRASVNPDDRWQQLAALGLARQIERWRADRMHAHYALAAAHFTGMVHQWVGVPFTFTTHACDVFDRPPADYPQLTSRSAGMVCISHYNRRYLMGRWGLPEHKLGVVRCGIRTGDYRAPAWKPPTSQPARVLCVARLHRNKGHQYLLQATAELHRMGVPLVLQLVGDGPERDPLERLADELGIKSCVQFLGFQEKSRVAHLLSHCHMHVLSSVSEGVPVAAMEAMACGRPSIATDVRGVGELVINGRTGLLVRPRDPHALAHAMSWVLANPDTAATMAQAGREHVLSEFDRRRCTRQLIEFWTDRGAQRQAG